MGFTAPCLSAGGQRWALAVSHGHTVLSATAGPSSDPGGGPAPCGGGSRHGRGVGGCRRQAQTPGLPVEQPGLASVPGDSGAAGHPAQRTLLPLFSPPTGSPPLALRLPPPTPGGALASLPSPVLPSRWNQSHVLSLGLPAGPVMSRSLRLREVQAGQEQRLGPCLWSWDPGRQSL